MKKAEDEKVLVELTHSEALVFFEWLAKHDGSLPIDDPAEQDVLWRIEASLERVLAEPLSPGYDTAVAAARQRLRKPE